MSTRTVRTMPVRANSQGKSMNGSGNQEQRRIQSITRPMLRMVTNQDKIRRVSHLMSAVTKKRNKPSTRSFAKSTHRKKLLCSGVCNMKEITYTIFSRTMESERLLLRTTSNWCPLMRLINLVPITGSHALQI